MHIRSFLLAFGTTTGLANHSGWWTSSMKLADFFTDEVLPLHGLLPRLLVNRRGVGVDPQMVLDHFPGDPGHL